MTGQCALVTSNFSTWGSCFQDMVFFGSPVVALIGIIAIFAYLAFKLNLPHEVSMYFAVGSTLMFALVFPDDPVVYSLAAFVVIVTIVYLVRGFYKAFRTQN